MTFRKFSAFALVSTAPFALGGCILGTAVEVVGETVEAGVEVTGAAAGAVVDVVTPDGDDDDKKDKDD